METKETIIFEIDVTDYVSQLKIAADSISLLTQKQKELRDSAKQGNEVAAKSLEAVNVELKNQQEAYKRTQAELAGFQKRAKETVDTVNFLNNSVNQNKALQKQLAEQYNATVKPSDKLIAAYKGVNEALRTQGMVVSDTRRNVGNYAEGFKSAFNEIKLGGTSLGEIIDPLSKMKSGFKDAGGGAAGLSAAFSSGILVIIPLVVSAFNFLSDALNSFKPIADQVERVTAAVGAGFGALIRGGNMKEAAAQAYELTAQLQDLEDTQNALIISNSQFDSQIKQLMVSLRNRNLTEKEGRKIIEDLRSAEQERFKQNSEIAKEELRIAREQFLNKTGLYSAELDALIERGKVKSQLDEEEIQNLMRSGDLTREQVIVIIEEEKKRQKTLADSAEKRASIDDKELKRITELTAKVNQIKGDSAVLNEQISNREDSFNERIKNENIKREEERLNKFTKLRQDELKSLEDTLAKEQELKDKAYEDETTRELNALVRREELLAEKTANPEVLIEAITLRRNLLLENEQLTETERQNIITESELKILGIKKQAADRDIKIAEDTAKTKQGIQQAELTFASGVSSALIGFIGDVADASGAGAEFQKVLAGIEIGVKTAVALAGAIAQAQSVPFPANLAAIGAGIAAVLGGVASAVGLLRKTPDVPKFALGGEAIDVGGKSHAQGGTKYYGEDGNSFEVERGEKMFVMKADASRDIAKLSSWNQKYGGNSWTGSPVRYAAAGGVIGNAGFDTRQVSTQALQRAEMTLAIKEAMLSAPAPVVSVKEFNKVNSGVQRSVRVSEV